jgi:hypothetical protein
MVMTLPHRIALLAAFLVMGSSAALAATILITSLGDGAWDSGDTRAAGYLDVHDDTQLVSGRNAVEDGLIANRIAFSAAPDSPPLGNGALRLTISSPDDKATLALSGWSEPFGVDMTFEYSWLVVGDGIPTVAAPAIKLGIDTSEANGTSALSVDRGEDAFDKILVFEPYFNGATLDDTWIDEIITPTDGQWWLVNLNSNSSLPPGGAADLRTLDQWASDFAAAGLGGATVSSLQLGIGSGNPAQESYVDYLTYSNTAGGDTTTWDFDAAAPPVPSSTALLSFMLAVLVGLLGVRALSATRASPERGPR